MNAQKLSAILLCLFLGASTTSAGNPSEAESANNDFVSAQCTLGTYVNATGKIFLRQRSSGGPTHISGVIGNVIQGLHGWHIHETAISDGDNPCGSAGGHFNPSGRNHGAPDAAERHVGDLGNFEANEFGVGVVDIIDPFVSLVGSTPESVIYRTIVIHAGEDDLGLGGDEESLRTGNAGARAGCCVIMPE